MSGGEAVRLRDDLRERAEFEAWAKCHDYDITRYEEEPNRYLNKHTRDAWEAWQAALAATGKQQVGEVQGDALWWLQDAINTMAEGGNETHTEKLQALHDALSARQPVEQQPVGTLVYSVDEDFHGQWDFTPEKPAYATLDRTPRSRGVFGDQRFDVYAAAPPAQAVDLGQFRDAVAFAIACLNSADDQPEYGQLESLLALIDGGKAVQS